MDDTKRCMSGAAGGSRPGHVRRATWCLAGAVCALLGASAEAQQPPPVAPAAATPPSSVPPAPVPVPPPETIPPPTPPAATAPPPVVPAPAVVDPVPPNVTTIPPPPPVTPPAVPPPPPPPPVALAAPPPPPAAPSWAPVFTGSTFSRYELRAGYDDLNVSSPTLRQRFLEGDAIYYRARLGIGTGLIDLGSGLKVGLQFTPQATGTFGNLTASPNAPNTIIDANLGLHEGYLRVAGPRTRVDVGRFELNYGDALVIGNLDWNEIGRSFDGARARIASSPTSAWLDLFVTLVDEGRPDFARGGTADQSPAMGFGDIYFLGAYGAFGPAIIKGLDLDVYALVRTWADAKNLKVNPADAMSPLYRKKKAAELTFGARAKQKLGRFDYRAEAGVQAGSRPGAAPTAAALVSSVDNVDVIAYHGDLELGLSFAEEKLRVSLEGLYASGNDPTTAGKNEGWDELFPTAHKFLGLSDVFVQGGQKRTNVASGVLHVTVAPSKVLTFNVDSHIFARPEWISYVNKVKGPDGLAGGEVDVSAVAVLAKGLKVRALYGVFLPNEHVYSDVLPNKPELAKGVDPAHYFELELRYDL